MSFGRSGQSAVEIYSDIIDLPHHEPKTRMRMPRSNRAASFSPFAALSGYDDTVKETARLTDARMVLDEDAKIALNERLQIAMEQLADQPIITITYFVADSRKAGGAYVKHTGVIKKIDECERKVIRRSFRVGRSVSRLYAYKLEYQRQRQEFLCSRNPAFFSHWR